MNVHALGKPMAGRCKFVAGDYLLSALGILLFLGLVRSVVSSNLIENEHIVPIEYKLDGDDMTFLGNCAGSLRSTLRSARINCLISTDSFSNQVEITNLCTEQLTCRTIKLCTSMFEESHCNMNTKRTPYPVKQYICQIRPLSKAIIEYFYDVSDQTKKVPSRRDFPISNVAHWITQACSEMSSPFIDQDSVQLCVCEPENVMSACRCARKPARPSTPAGTYHHRSSWPHVLTVLTSNLDLLDNIISSVQTEQGISLIRFEVLENAYSGMIIKNLLNSEEMQLQSIDPNVQNECRDPLPSFTVVVLILDQDPILGFYGKRLANKHVLEMKWRLLQLIKTFPHEGAFHNCAVEVSLMPSEFASVLSLLPDKHIFSDNSGKYEEHRESFARDIEKILNISIHSRLEETPQEWLTKNIKLFLSSFGSSHAWTGDSALNDSKPTSLWIPELEKRIQKRREQYNEALYKEARFMTLHLSEGLRHLESLGYHPFARDGLLIGTMRHRGWIDFGGTEYQTGYDMDPDAQMTADELDSLMKSPTIGGGYTWKPYLSLKAYVYRHCPFPRKTVEFYNNVLKINVHQQRGGELYYEGKLVASFAAIFRWKYPDSFIFPMCWRRIFNSKPLSAYALMMLKSDIYPVKHFPFYNTTLPVPAKPYKVMKGQWGDDVMTCVRIKTTEDRGTITDSYLLPSGYAPAVPLGPCVSDAV